MKRFLVIILVVLPATLLIALVSLGAHPTTTRAQVVGAIRGYLHYRAPEAGSINSIQQLVPASWPRNFTPQMSEATFGYGAYFKSDFRYATFSPIWEGQMKPVPYPPTDVWCARLQPPGNKVDSYSEIIFIAQHEDDYQAEWIVHDASAKSTQQLTADLAAVGCSELMHP